MSHTANVLVSSNLSMVLAMEKGLNKTPTGLLVTENFALAKRDEICSAKQEPRAKTFLLWSMPSANFAISISVRNFIFKLRIED